MSGHQRPTSRVTPKKPTMAERLRTDNAGIGPDHPNLTHRQVWIEHEDRAAWIDQGVADLILACWRNGIDTLSSCENTHEWLPEVYDRKHALVTLALSGKGYQRWCELMGRRPPKIGGGQVRVLAFSHSAMDKYTAMLSGGPRDSMKTPLTTER